MAQENPYAKYQGQSQPVPIAQIKPILSAPRDPFEAEKEARAQDAAAIAQQQAGIAARGEERQVGQQSFQRQAELRKEFLTLPDVKDFRNVLNSTQQIMSLAQGEGSAMGDLAAIFSYMKTLDPGSTVREGEAASAQNAAGIPDRVRNYYNNLISGERLSPEQRADMANTAITLYKSRAGNYNALVNTYSGLLQAEGADPVANGVVPAPELAFKPAQAAGEQLAITGGEQFSTDQDRAIMQATQQAWASGLDVQGIVAAAQAAGGNITASDVANIQAAVEARDKGQSVSFVPSKTGTRNPISQGIGEFLTTPLGTGVTGAVNAAGAGLLSQVAGDQVQGLEALNPVAGMTGEIVGSALGTAGIAKGAGAALGAVAPGLAGRLAGGGIAGAVGRELATDATYGGIYGANTGEGALTGAALGAAGSLGGQAVAAGARRAAPVVSGMFRRDVPPDGGVPPMGGGPDGMLPTGGAPMGGAPMSGAAMQAADEPFAPVTFRSRDAGSAGTSDETLRYAKAEGLPVPIELTRGAATRDPEQLAFEKEQIFNALGGPLRSRAQENNLQALGNFERMVDLTGAQETTIATAGSPVIKALSAGYKNMKNKVNVAYKRAEKSPEAQEPVSYADLQAYVNGQDEATKEIAPVLKSVAQQIAKNDPDGTGQISVATMENIRKLINRNAQPGTPSSVYAGEMKGIIDGLTEGKGGALYEQARKLRREQARKFESREVVARLVSNIKKLDDPKVAANEVFAKSILNENPDDIKFLRQTLKTLGPDGRQAWQELQGATVRHLEEAATKGARMGEDDNPVVAAGQFKKAVDALDKDGRIDVIFNPKMAQQVRDLRDVIMYVNTVPPGTSINSSGTGRTIAALLGEMTVNGSMSAWLTGTPLPVPVVSGLRFVMKSKAENEIKKKIARSLLPRDAQ